MQLLRAMGAATLLICAAQASTLTITSGDIYVQAAFANVYFDTVPLPQGFFGSIDGIPSDPIVGGLLSFVGEHAGVSASPLLSNIEDMSIVFSRGMPSGTADLAFTGVPDPASADTVLALLNSVTFTDGGNSPVSFAYQHFSMLSVAPLLVTYGTGPDAQMRYFDATFSLSDAGGGNVQSNIVRTGEDAGAFVASSLRSSGTVVFTNSDVGTFTRGLTLRGTSGGGTWTVTPEPNSFTMLLLGAMGIAVIFRRSRRMRNRVPVADLFDSSQHQC